MQWRAQIPICRHPSKASVIGKYFALKKVTTAAGGKVRALAYRSLMGERRNSNCLKKEIFVKCALLPLGRVGKNCTQCCGPRREHSFHMSSKISKVRAAAG